MTDTTTRIRLLNSRGIGKRYHKLSLKEYKHAEAENLMSWVTTERTDSDALLFFGETQEGYDLAVLTARALILTKLPKLHCVSFYTATEYETVNELWSEKPPLLITNFKPDHSVDPERYRRLENLLNYYLDNNIPVFLHLPVDANAQPIEYGNQLSPVFLDRLLKNNTKFVIN